MNMDKRQKLIAVFLVVAMIILGWQVYALLSDKNGSSHVPFVSSGLKEAANPADVMGASSQSKAGATSFQSQYMKLVNEYQVLQIQNMIAQTQASIAKSRAQTAEALSKLNDLSGGNTDVADLGLTQTSTSDSGDYELIYTGQENGQWTATLKKGGQFSDVTTGTTLPDGTKILSVDANGVVVDENKTKKLVTFNGVTAYSEPTATTPAPATKAADDNQDKASDKSADKAEDKPKKKSDDKSTDKPVEKAAEKTVDKSADKTASKTSDTKDEKKTEDKPAEKPAEKPVEKAAEKTAEKTTSAQPLAPKVVAASAPVLDITKANENDYTIQLFADREIDTVNDFITDNKLGGKALTLKTKSNSGIWYIGVYGDFLTVEEAEKALKALPASVKEEGAFVRRVGNVLKGVVK